MSNENTPTVDEALEETRELLGEIADALRTKTGSTGPINAQDFASIIASL